MIARYQIDPRWREATDVCEVVMYSDGTVEERRGASATGVKHGDDRANRTSEMPGDSAP